MNDECMNRVRYKLSDVDGALHFVEFGVEGGLACEGAGEALKDYLTSRPLSELDPDAIRAYACPGSGECMQAIAKLVEESQGLFAPRSNGTP